MAIQEVPCHSVLFMQQSLTKLYSSWVGWLNYTEAIQKELPRQPFNWSFCAQILSQSSYIKAEPPSQVDFPTPTASTRMKKEWIWLWEVASQTSPAQFPWSQASVDLQQWSIVCPTSVKSWKLKPKASLLSCSGASEVLCWALQIVPKYFFKFFNDYNHCDVFTLLLSYSHATWKFHKVYGLIKYCPLLTSTRNSKVAATCQCVKR